MADPHSARLAALRTRMAAHSLDAMLVPRSDAHQSEVTPEHDNCLKWISGFSGSAGMALILPDRALIFVDGRYQVQVRHEVDVKVWEIHHLLDEPPESWIATQSLTGQQIGVDAMRVTLNQFRRLDNGCNKAGAALVPLTEDLFDEIWHDRPAPPAGAIREMPETAAGEARVEKIARIAASLDADLLVETMPDNIAWLLNVRGSDVAMNPVPLSFLMLDAQGNAEWFVDRSKLSNALMQSVCVPVSPADQLLPRLTRQAAGKAVVMDPDFTPAAVARAIVDSGGSLIEAADPITLAKAVKNCTELQGFRDCHLEDGVAMVEFLAWLEEEAEAGSLPTELQAEAQLLHFRSLQPGFLEPSFRTISAAASNAAMCHYASGPETDTRITTDAPYLVDSGGQYRNGTTDVTRTMMFGRPSPEMGRTYTAVLQGFIALHDARFPTGTTGHQLDALARLPLWQLGLDYDHGTGHGVGHNLLIHEYPHRFAKKINNFGLYPGNIMTIEPGFYPTGSFGMRVENQVEVVADKSGFCRFDALTLVPIDLTMADTAALTARETAWIDSYHARVHELISGRVSLFAQNYLERATRPIAQRT